MPTDSLDRPNPSDPTISVYSRVVGIAAGVAIILGIGALGFAFWSSAQSQASIDALTAELEEAQTELLTLDDTIAAGAEAVNVATSERIEDIDEAAATAIADMDTTSARAISAVSSAAAAAASASSDIQAIERELHVLEGEVQETNRELEETREWVGDLAHCLVLEAEQRRYSYWTTGSGYFTNRGTNDLYIEQMSHCE